MPGARAGTSSVAKGRLVELHRRLEPSTLQRRGENKWQALGPNTAPPCRLWVKPEVAALPRDICFRERTWSGCPGTSEKCQKRHCSVVGDVRRRCDPNFRTRAPIRRRITPSIRYDGR